MHRAALLAAALWCTPAFGQDGYGPPPDARALSARVAPGSIRSSALRALRARLVPLVRALDRERVGEGRYFVTLHRTLRPGVPEADRIRGLLLRNSRSPWENDFLFLEVETVPPSLDAVAGLFQVLFDEVEQAPDHRLRAVPLHAAVSEAIATRRDLVFWKASWKIGDVDGSEATGFAVSDPRTGELLWVRRAYDYEGERGLMWSTFAAARTVSDAERADTRALIDALPAPARARIEHAFVAMWFDHGERDWLQRVGARAAAFRGRDGAEQRAFVEGAFVLLAGLIGEDAEPLRGTMGTGEALLRAIATMPLPAGLDARHRRRLEREARQALRIP